MTTVQANHRFALVRRKETLPLGSPERRLLDAAHYWESFPDSYTPEQVEVAEALLVAIGTSDYAEALSRVADLYRAEVSR